MKKGIVMGALISFGVANFFYNGLIVGYSYDVVYGIFDFALAALLIDRV